MSEYINNVSRRKEILRDVLIQLHQGKSVEEVKTLFSDLAQEATAEEIAHAEQLLIEDGLPVEEIQRLCDVHVAVFQDELNKQQPPEMIPGHPVHTFIAENEILSRFIEGMHRVVQDYHVSGESQVLVTFRYQLEKLAEFERHYLRKEMLLFPFLENYGFYGPSKVMWGIQDEIRSDLRRLKEWLGSDSQVNPVELESRFDTATRKMLDMVYKEENILFPAAINHLKEQDWRQIRSEEEEIGYFLVVPGQQWPQQGTPVEQIHQRVSQSVIPEKPASIGEVPLNTGVLTIQQIDLLLCNLPVDVTFVDERDTVRYFSQSRERIFQRTPAIIGRKVQNCHPPHSVDRVQKILDDFRSGTRDSAEFWIDFAGRMIHIRYFALRDQKGTYQGTLEVTQDISDIRALEGERRLLD